MAAAAVGLQAAKSTGELAAGVIARVINALEKPIYTNLHTDTHTWVGKPTDGAPEGTVHTTTHSKGWTIPLGVPVLFVGSVAAWEIGTLFARAVSGWFGTPAAVAQKIQDAIDFSLNPLNWPTEFYNVGKAAAPVIESVGGALQGAEYGLFTGAQTTSSSYAKALFNAITGVPVAVSTPQNPVTQPPGTVAVSRPPSAMASISNLIRQIADPLAAMGGNLAGRAFAVIGKAAASASG